MKLYRPTDSHRPVPEPGGRDRGSLSVFVAALAPALLLCTAGFVNAATRWNTWRDANAAADAAARAAVQVSPQEFSSGSRVLKIDAGLANQRAHAVLAASGYDGTVTVSSSGRDVTVRVTAQVDYILPGGAFASEVTGTGTAHLSSGVMDGS